MPDPQDFSEVLLNIERACVSPYRRKALEAPKLL